MKYKLIEVNYPNGDFKTSENTTLEDISLQVLGDPKKKIPNKIILDSNTTLIWDSELFMNCYLDYSISEEELILLTKQ